MFGFPTIFFFENPEIFFLSEGKKVFFHFLSQKFFIFNFFIFNIFYYINFVKLLKVLNHKYI